MWVTTTAPDQALLLKIVEGDETAFRQFFDAYNKKIYLYLLTIVKSPQIAEEITEDVFVKLWVGRKLVGEIRDPNAFLQKVAYFKALDFLKTVARNRKFQEKYNNWYLENIAEKTPEDLLVDAELIRSFKEAIAKLTPQRKLIYQLSRDEGLTHEQIAHQLNLSRNTVKNSMMAATRFLTAYIRDKSFDPIILIMMCNIFFEAR